jgi:hypothetical protein
VRIFGNRVLMRTYRPKTDEMVGWRKLLHNWYSLPYIIGIVEPNRMRWAWCIISMGEDTQKMQMGE